jgi:hypothetical protein
MVLYLNQRCHYQPHMSEFTFLILHNSRICRLQWNSSQQKSHHNRHPTNQFLSLTIEVVGYLHKHANVFLHDCAMPFGA